MKKSVESFVNSSSDSASGKGFSEIFPVMLLNILHSFLVSYFSTVMLLMGSTFLAHSSVV